jgi:signal transduction histidine kinase
VLTELLAVGAVAGLVQAFPTFVYPGIIPLLAIASVALAWGAGPSLAATAVGAAGLDLLVLPPRFVWHLDGLDDVVEVGLFVVVGVVIAAGASRTERARRTAQDLADQLDAVIDAMADGVYLCNRAGRIQKTNAALRRLLALDDQAAHSSRPLDDQAALFMPRDSEGQLLPHEKWPMVRVLKGETLTGAHAVDMRIRTLDGRELELNTSGAPVRDADGRVTGGVFVARDVTERRRLERERLLRERAEARAQEWVLREANQRMDEFVSLATHELKTPLAAIQGFVELAHHNVQGALSQERAIACEVTARCSAANSMLERAEQRIGHLTRLMNGLLDVSRIQAGHLEMRQDICDLAEIVRTCIDTQRLVWPGRTITLDEPAEAMHIRGDADRIGQVVINYVTNALKYSAAHQPVAVSLLLQGTEVYVQVRDQGPGLTVEQQTHIWERYRRVQGVAVQDKTRGAGGSLGLGLYISWTIIEQHGGRVGVESRPGSGSTFWFALPLSP